MSKRIVVVLLLFMSSNKSYLSHPNPILSTFDIKSKLFVPLLSPFTEIQLMKNHLNETSSTGRIDLKPVGSIKNIYLPPVTMPLQTAIESTASIKYLNIMPR
jgi:hypothetical protein